MQTSPISFYMNSAPPISYPQRVLRINNYMKFWPTIIYFNYEMKLYCLTLEVDNHFNLEIFVNLMHKTDKLGRSGLKPSCISCNITWFWSPQDSIFCLNFKVIMLIKHILWRMLSYNMGQKGCFPHLFSHWCTYHQPSIILQDDCPYLHDQTTHAYIYNLCTVISSLQPFWSIISATEQ